MKTDPKKRGFQVSAVLETKPNGRRSWYDYNWDWALISLLALVLLAGIVVWTNVHQSPTAVTLDGATIGQSTRPDLPIRHPTKSN